MLPWLSSTYQEKLRKLQVGLVGFSEYFRMYYKERWNEKLTEKVIASVEYKVSVNFDLLNTGILKLSNYIDELTSVTMGCACLKCVAERKFELLSSH